MAEKNSSKVKPEDDSVNLALDLLDKSITDYQRLKPLPFDDFLNILKANPS